MTGKEQQELEWHQGQVRWFDPKRRYGFVIPEQGDEDVFLYWRELRNSGVPESKVKDGERVKFTRKLPDKPGRCKYQVDLIELLSTSKDMTT